MFLEVVMGFFSASFFASTGFINILHFLLLVSWFCFVLPSHVRCQCPSLNEDCGDVSWQECVKSQN